MSSLQIGQSDVCPASSISAQQSRACHFWVGVTKWIVVSEHGWTTIDSALVRLRPVLVTVLATVGGLIPLALEGGPLWEPL